MKAGYFGPNLEYRATGDRFIQEPTNDLVALALKLRGTQHAASDLLKMGENIINTHYEGKDETERDIYNIQRRSVVNIIANQLEGSHETIAKYLKRRIRDITSTSQLGNLEDVCETVTSSAPNRATA